MGRDPLAQTRSSKRQRPAADVKGWSTVCVRTRTSEVTGYRNLSVLECRPYPLEPGCEVLLPGDAETHR